MNRNRLWVTDKTRTPHGTTARVRYFPAVFLLPVLAVGPLKAAGMNSFASVDLTVASMLVILVAGMWSLVTRGFPQIVWSWPLVLMIIILAASSLWAPSSTYAQTKLVLLVALTFPAALAVLLLIRTGAELHGYLRMWIFAGVILVMVAWVTPRNTNLSGRLGIDDNTLGLAYLAGAALVLVIAEAFLGSMSKWVALSLATLLSFSLVSVGSRGPVVAALVSMLFLFVVAPGGRQKRWLVIPLGLLLIMTVVLASDVAVQRLLVLDGATRTALRAEAQRIWLSNPIAGVGFGGFETLNPTFRYPHNVFSELTAEAGLLGLTAFILVLGVLARRYLRYRTSLLASLSGSLALFVIVGQQFSSDLTNRIFWLGLIPLLLLPVALSSYQNPDRRTQHREQLNAHQFPLRGSTKTRRAK